MKVLTYCISYINLLLNYSVESTKITL
uniref:Uncharacterized protein n=1 Tax=Anguilla anguilla TaxID=7936 RepID=A0A0E9PH50_ANGAN